MSQLALAYNLNQPEIYCVIPGAKNADQVMANVLASGLEIPKADMEKLAGLQGFTYTV